MTFDIVNLCHATVLPTLFNDTDKSERHGGWQSEQ